jgi:hypothetical protein
MTTTEASTDTTTGTTGPVPVRLDFERHAAGFSRALAQLDQAATLQER